MKKIAKVAPLIGLALAGSLLLAGCTNNDNTPKPSSTTAAAVDKAAVTDTKAPVDKSALSFGTSPKITVAPTWSAVKAVPAGWVATPTDAAAEADSKAQGFPIPAQPFFNKANTAEVSVITGFDPTTDTGRGELYLSQDYLYSQFDGDGTAVKISEPQVVKLKTADGTIDAFGVYFEGKDIAPFKGDVKGFRVVRVFDTTVPTNFKQVAGQTNQVNGLPVLSLTYVAQAADFKKISEDGSPLELFTANLK
jgi:outer membrane murein-binding lipoprotein Lpp